MKEITRKLIEAARQRRTYYGCQPYRFLDFPNPTRVAMAALARRERARLGRHGWLRRINCHGKPILLLQPPEDQPS